VALAPRLATIATKRILAQSDMASWGAGAAAGRSGQCESAARLELAAARSGQVSVHKSCVLSTQFVY
jgi:hypothetical protein